MLKAKLSLLDEDDTEPHPTKVFPRLWLGSDPPDSEWLQAEGIGLVVSCENMAATKTASGCFGAWATSTRPPV